MKTICLILLATTLSLPAQAETKSAAGNDMAWMPTGGRTTQPIGHYLFCQDNPSECQQKSTDTSKLKLTPVIWKQLISVNNAVNAAIEEQTDQETWGVEEKWTFPTSGVGDDEEYAIEKRRRLLKMELPETDLLLTVARTSNGSGHLVLTVRTDRGSTMR